MLHSTYIFIQINNKVEQSQKAAFETKQSTN